MKIFVLGGYGKTGKQAIELLASNDLVTKITIAGRNLEQAENAAADIGEKAIGLQVDGTDEQELKSLTMGYDIIVNAASNDVVIPSIRAAIHNKIHYCDLAWAEILEEAVQLNQEAEAEGITVIIANGISPSITNLMGAHAARQLDEVQQIQVGRTELINFEKGIDPTPDLWLEDPKTILSSLQNYRSFIGWTLKRLQDNGSRMLIDPRGKKLVGINPINDGLEVPMSQGGLIKAYPVFSGDDDWGQTPKGLAVEKSVELWFSPFPPPLDAILREQAKSILRGEVDSEVGANIFYETVENDPDRWLTPPEDFSKLAKVWIRAVGRKEGKGACSYCWFTAPMWYVGGYYLTSVALAAAVRMILRGEIQKKGVITAEKAFDPLSFLREVAALISDFLPDGIMIEESIEWVA